MAEGFEKLEVWQRAMDLTELLHLQTRTFPKDEMFGLTSQLRRASSSIASNIAEGYGRVGKGDYIKHLGYARGSACEVKTHILTAMRVGYLQQNDSLLLTERIHMMLNKLIHSLQAQQVREPDSEYRTEDA